MIILNNNNYNNNNKKKLVTYKTLTGEKTNKNNYLLHQKYEETTLSNTQRKFVMVPV